MGPAIASPRASRSITAALQQGQMGEYQVQAAIAAVHDQAARYEDTELVRDRAALQRRSNG